MSKFNKCGQLPNLKSVEKTANNRVRDVIFHVKAGANNKYKDSL
jgi:hypothetical protein